MRLSGIVIAVLVCFSTILPAQHSSAAGGSSSNVSSASGSSHSSSGSSGSISGSSFSHAGRGGESGVSLGAGRTSSAGGSSGKAGSTAVRSINGGANENGIAHHKSPSSLKPEKKSFVTFLKHPFKKPKSVADNKRPPCRKEPCPVCPPGESRQGKGACGPVFANNFCGAGQLWNGFTCGQTWWEDCQALAHELAAERQQMQGQVDPFQSLRYQRLQEQYDQCRARFGGNPFNAILLDTPWELSDFWEP
jgi:hypothetical protein